MKSPASATPTSSPPPPTEETTADLPGFKAPRRMPTDDLDPDRTTLLDPLEPETAEADSSDPIPSRPPGLDGDEFDEPSPNGTSETPSSRGFTNPELFQAPIAGLVQLASLGVHTARRAPGALWLADEDDVANITVPLARIAARHSPVAAGQANDLADGIETALGVANYAVKNLRAEAEAAAPAPAEPPTPYQATP